MYTKCFSPFLTKRLKRIFAWDHNSVPTKMLFELPTDIGFAENQLS